LLFAGNFILPSAGNSRVFVFSLQSVFKVVKSRAIRNDYPEGMMTKDGNEFL
jgi:hypothetical protein